jgi:nucleotide-binding universal stress UspA family protein
MAHFNILAPLDFSDSSPLVLQTAERIAELFEGKVTPFHSFIPMSNMYANDPFALEGMSAPMVPNMEELEQMYQEQLHELGSKHIAAGLLGQPEVAVGNPVATIIDTADHHDFIVMGSHGHSGFSRMFMGSVSDKILRSVHKPVLIVNQERELKSVKHIMLTTDFSERSKQAFPIAVDIAVKTQAKVTLIHILSYNLAQGEPDEEAISRQKQRLDELAKQELSSLHNQMKTKVILSSNNAHEAILDESLNNPYDLVVMATVGHTGIKYMMMGSTTSHVMRHVQIPVLSINPKAKQVSDEEE